MATSRPRKTPATRSAQKRSTQRPASARRPVRSAVRKRGPQGGAGERAPQFTGRAIILLAIVLLLVASYTSSLHTWWEQRQEIQSAHAEIAMRKAAIAKLEERKERWDDPEFVRQQARDRFGWVLPGEVGYRVIGSDGSVEGASLDEPVTADEPQWFDRLWTSTQLAGRDPAVEAEP